VAAPAGVARATRHGLTFAPAGVPKPIVDRLAAEMIKAGNIKLD
jgi:hypothetical protein